MNVDSQDSLLGRHFGGRKTALIYCASYLLLTACSNAIPESTSLALSTPTFSGALEKTFVIASYNDSIVVSGECDKQTVMIDFQPSGGSWVTASGSDVDCSNGDFVFTIPDCSALGFSASSPQGHIVDVALRTHDSFGSSSQTVFHVQLGSAFKVPFGALSVAAGVQSGANFKLNGRVGRTVSSTSLSGANYKVKLRGEE